MTVPLSETPVVSISNDEQDKAQTLSITLRQGNTQELPWRYYHYNEETVESKREGVVLIQHLAARVFISKSLFHQNV